MLIPTLTLFPNPNPNPTPTLTLTLNPNRREASCVTRVASRTWVVESLLSPPRVTTAWSEP
eukprot:scaffold76178_cov37-Phaeocystis_antarctica.AAC.2